MVYIILIILPIPRGNYALNTASINIKGCLPLIEHTVLLSTIAQHNTTILSPMLLSLEEINSRLIRRVSFFKTDSSQILPILPVKWGKTPYFFWKIGKSAFSSRKVCLIALIKWQTNFFILGLFLVVFFQDDPTSFLFLLGGFRFNQAIVIFDTIQNEVI